MGEKKSEIVVPNYSKYEGLVLHEPKTLVQLLANFQGVPLAIAAISVLVTAFAFRAQVSMLVQVCAIVSISVLGLAQFILSLVHSLSGKANASSPAQTAKNSSEPRHAVAGEEPARGTS